jgi:hypothetical protein
VETIPATAPGAVEIPRFRVIVSTGARFIGVTAGCIVSGKSLPATT